MTEEKSCENCIYFRQHYTKLKFHFMTVSCGHCTNKKAKYDRRRSFPLTEACDYWESEEPQTREEVQEAIGQELKRIGDRLEELNSLLLDLNSR